MSKAISFPVKEWFLENSFPGVRRCKSDLFRIDKEIFKGKSKFQDIRIFKSPGFGRMLSLDSIIQLSESDEFIYHEIIAHVPLFSHPNPKRFLVVGGGDGGVLREAAKHPLKEMYQVEIDRQIVELSQKYLPFISKGAFQDKRLKIFFEDGFKFLRRYKNFFDVIVVDSTDPVGPGKILFSNAFYKILDNSLTDDGIAIFQLGPFLDFNLIVKPTAKKLKTLFKYVHPVRLSMPSYSCGCEYCFLIASKKIDPASLTPKEIAKRLKQSLGSKEKTLKYYTPDVHCASMVMPKLWQI
ncbi:MAG: polyamine aminopropyltransferase [Candidatus Omnitrophica bacterium]|nr:polyamine aminopropyltransferase [Candidatus Omnitrophota bacterium]